MALRCSITWQEIRLTAMQTKAHDEDIVDERDMAVAVLNAAKKTVISKVCVCMCDFNAISCVTSNHWLIQFHNSHLSFVRCMTSDTFTQSYISASFPPSPLQVHHNHLSHVLPPRLPSPMTSASYAPSSVLSLSHHFSCLCLSPESL